MTAKCSMKRTAMADSDQHPPFRRIGPERPASPVVLSVPHAGRSYSPALLRAARLPRAKLEVLEAADRGLAGLHALAERAVVAVTGDHATPSTGGVLHTGDPTPLIVAGPGVRPDGVTAFGEAPAHAGWYGTVRASELLPLLFGHANRPVFLGHRATARRTLALPDSPEPMPL